MGFVFWLSGYASQGEGEGKRLVTVGPARSCSSSTGGRALLVDRLSVWCALLSRRAGINGLSPMVSVDSTYSRYIQLVLRALVEPYGTKDLPCGDSN